MTRMMMKILLKTKMMKKIRNQTRTQMIHNQKMRIVIRNNNIT
jgi:hypothetical protein